MLDLRIKQVSAMVLVKVVSYSEIWHRTCSFFYNFIIYTQIIKSASTDVRRVSLLSGWNLQFRLYLIKQKYNFFPHMNLDPTLLFIWWFSYNLSVHARFKHWPIVIKLWEFIYTGVNNRYWWVSQSCHPQLSTQVPQHTWVLHMQLPTWLQIELWWLNMYK